MEKGKFLDEIKDALELTENITEVTSIHLTSLQVLIVIAFIDENFDKQIKVADLKKAQTFRELMELIGIEHFN